MVEFVFSSMVEGQGSRVEGSMSRVEGTMSRVEGNFVSTVFLKKEKLNRICLK